MLTRFGKKLQIYLIVRRINAEADLREICMKYINFEIDFYDLLLAVNKTREVLENDN